MADPLEEPRPRFTDAQLAEELASGYGLSGRLTSLHGERDLNFRVDSDSGSRFLLKIHNPAEKRSSVEMRTGALRHLDRIDPGLPVPKVVATTDGDDAMIVTGADGRQSIAQLFTYLPGRHAGRDELGAEALFGWGRSVARLARSLRGYFHQAADYEIQWDLRRTASLRERLHVLGEQEAGLVLPVIERFESKVAPVLLGLRAQLVHNDMSRQNVLVDERLEVVGITDFGDMTFAPLICDLAIAVADVLDGRPDWSEMAGHMISGYSSVTPLEPEEAAVLGDLVAARLAIAVVVSTWRLCTHADAPEFPETTLNFLRLLTSEGLEVVSGRLESVAREMASSSPAAGPARSTADLVAARRRSLGPLALSYDEPLHIVRGEGVYLYDDEGRRYLDAYNNVPVLGHCHPAVVETISRQSRRLVTNTRYLQEESVGLAEELIDRAPVGLDRVLFVNSGSEANDIAWRIARFATGRDGALVTEHAYHGVTCATTDLSPEEWPAGFAPPNVGLVAPPAPSRADNTAEVLEELSAKGHAPAAFFVDPAFTSDGIYGPAHDWLRRGSELVRSAGGLLVADEVQVGFGRTGEGLWSITTSGLEPDFMTLGKPMGNGFPVAALLGRSQLVDPFIERTGYFSTFGGNTLACATARAVLHTIEREGLVAEAARSGARLRALLEQVASRHEQVGGLRAWGLLIGLEIIGEEKGPDPRCASLVVNGLRRLGVLVGATGAGGNVIKVRPPLVFSEEHGEMLAEALDASLKVATAAR
jgi:4-aminobutyrate aminotransferase-like enzyme/Ser/Thr protein kinase RdoA (MazF antagonist)